MSDIDYDKIQRRAAYDDLIGPLYDLEPSQLAAREAHPIFGAKDHLNKDLPLTPPHSPSTPRSSSRPGFFARLSQSSLRDAHDSEPQSPFQEFLRRNSSRRTTRSTRSTRSNRSNSVKSETQSPQYTREELFSVLYTSQPAQTRWNQGTILSRANSVAVSNPTLHRQTMSPPRETRHHRGQSLNASSPQDRPSNNMSNHTPRRGVSLRDSGPAAPHILDQPIHETPSPSPAVAKGKTPQRERSLRERYPGDMSHRPLDIIKRQTRAADRAAHLHSPSRQQPRDTIDTLDHAGPLYHHSGPFDPVLAARNTDPKTSPVEAVKSTNAEALRATPAEHLADSLAKHVPLQGTATVPPGLPDLAGRTMRYEEGADLMREPDAAGGPYKRWEGVTYQDGDLKGKGEPAYTYERDLAKRKAVPRSSGRGGGGEEMGVEMMQPRSTGTGFGYEAQGKDAGAQVRHRSVKPLPSPPVEEERGGDPFADQYAPAAGGATTSGVQRGGIVGSIKRKILRRK